MQPLESDSNAHWPTAAWRLTCPAGLGPEWSGLAVQNLDQTGDLPRQGPVEPKRQSWLATEKVPTDLRLLSQTSM